MRILVADDDPISRRTVQHLVGRQGHEVLSAVDGDQAWELLHQPDAPRLAILDWMMPGMDGPDICRLLREERHRKYVYVILLSAREQKTDIIAGLDAGADDYITKPFDAAELRSRVRAGLRVVTLESQLTEKIAELEDAIAHVHQLQGLLPICMHCKSIRDDDQTWSRIEEYLAARSDIVFSHGLCDTCLDKYYPAPDDDEDEVFQELDRA